LSFTVTGLAPATTYTIAVTAVDAAANESLAAERTITTSIQTTTPIANSSGGGSMDWFLELLLLVVLFVRRFSQFAPKLGFV
jgi:hypothetical protein